MTSNTTDDFTLQQKCESMAYRAERIHDWLDSVLRQSRAAEHAYAFKGRLKTSEDIQNKVHARRNHEDEAQRKPEYGPADVTDVSGFRIVKLFNAEVPEALNQILSLLKTKPPAGTPNGKFKGSGVKQIEFHTSRRINDPLSIYPEVKRVVESHGFNVEPPEPKTGRGDASSYSSVHVLVECEVPQASGRPICACSEIQLRSVFEEAWSEISHRLKYAPVKAARASTATPLPEDKPLSDLWLHLDALKSLTDGCAQYADLINRQLQSLATERAERQQHPLDPATKSAAQFADQGPTLRKAAERAYRLRTEAVKAKDVRERAAAYQRAADAFQAAINALPEPEPSAPERQRLADVLREELAFCNMSTGNDELRNRAEKVYRELLKRQPNRMSLLLRLGQLRRDAGALGEARELIERGLAAAQNPDPDPEVQRQASWLLRYELALICWRQVDLDQVRATDAVSLLRRAIDLSEEALKLANTDNQRLETGLNLLYYLVDLWERLPDDTERQELVAKGTKLLDETRQKADMDSLAVEWLDSMMRAEVAFGTPDRAGAAAKVVSERLAARIINTRKELNCSDAQAFDALSRDDRDMYLYALKVLASGGPSGTGANGLRS